MLLSDRDVHNNRLPGRALERPGNDGLDAALAQIETLTEPPCVWSLLDGVGCLGWPEVLHNLYRRNLIDVDTLRAWLWLAWGWSTRPHLALATDQWRELFRAVGYNVAGQPAIATDMTLHRGSPIGTRHNWSWTPNLPLAYEYAGGKRISQFQKGHVWTVNAPAEAILCHLPSSHEYVVDTAGLDVWGRR